MTEPTIGHNRPDPAEAIVRRLSVDYSGIAETIDAAERDALALPSTIDTKDDHDTCVDFVSKVRATYKGVEATRVAEKDPYLKGERAVDGFFEPLKTRAEHLMTSVSYRVKAYLDRKAYEERMAREAAAREERRKAEALRAAEAERQRKADEARRAETRRKHEEVAAALANQAQEAEDTAIAMETETDKMKPADLARTRSEATGTLSTLASHWTFEVEDLAKVPLNELRAYIPQDTIRKAIRAYVRMGGRTLSGVRIYEDTKVNIR